MVTASVDRPVSEVLKLAADSAYTRIPVYEGDIDHIVGFVHLRDLFTLYRSDAGADIRSIVRPAPFVPESLTSAEVWERLDEAQSYLAIVFDEYGGTSGMITREDLVEELFGEVQDEFDQEQALITATGAGRISVRGDMLISNLNDRLEINLPHDESHTIGGLVMDRLGRIPQVGDAVEIAVPRTSEPAVIHLQVEAVDHRSVTEVCVTLPSEEVGLMSILISFVIIAILILINGLFVAAEFAIIGVRPTRVEQLAAGGNRAARWVQSILNDRRKTDRYIATAQLGITLASLGLGMYAEPAIAHLIEAPLHDWFGLEGTIVHTISFIIALAADHLSACRGRRDGAQVVGAAERRGDRICPGHPDAVGRQALFDPGDAAEPHRPVDAQAAAHPAARREQPALFPRRIGAARRGELRRGSAR